MSDLVRCPWVTDDQTYRDYHDNEWGEELRGQRELYEKITLEGFQAGLSWLTILKRRESFRLAFDGFDIQKIAAYGPQKIESLMAASVQDAAPVALDQTQQGRLSRMDALQRQVAYQRQEYRHRCTPLLIQEDQLCLVRQLDQILEQCQCQLHHLRPIVPIYPLVFR